MKSVTILFIILGLFNSIDFVIGSSKNWKCRVEGSFAFSIIFDCACIDDCNETIYDTDEFECDLAKENVPYKGVTKIIFQNCTLSAINTLQIEKFPEIELFLNDIKFDRFDREILNEDCDAIELFAENNKITSIGKNAFKHLTKLNSMHLQLNSIETIEDGTFADLTRLQKLDLHNNKLSSINETTFSKLNRLHALWLYENNINTIHKNAFNDLIHLRYLNLHFNQITHIEPRTFASLTELKWLWLSKNLIQKFNFELLSPMHQTLEMLYLHENQLTELEIAKDLYFPALWLLNISKNKFDCYKLQRFYNTNEGYALKDKAIF